MASSRIRYSKMDDTKMKSVKTFNHVSNGARYDVILDTKESQWLVLDAGSGIVAASGHQTSMHKAKIEAKKALVELGIIFDKEVRGEESIDIPVNNVRIP